MAVAADHPGVGDHDLVAATRTGSAAAFGVLAERHYAAVLGYLAYQTGDPDLAADLAQETFLAAFRSLQHLRDDCSFAAWLYQIARTQLRMHRRRDRLRRLVSLDWLAGRADAAELALPRADTTAESAERELIERALAGLSPALREALLLHSAWGFPANEVALILGIGPAAARQRIGRAKEQFRLRYRALGGGDDDATV